MTTKPPLELRCDPSAPHTVEAKITFIGTATTLLEIVGFTILTDPNFLRQGQRAYVGMGISTKRLTEPAMSIEELPELDFVVLSHHHGDHFDRVAVKKLDHDIPIVTEPHAARKLAKQGFRRPIALETWESQTVTKGQNSVRVTSVPGKHAPNPLGLLVPPVMGSVLEFFSGEDFFLRLYVTGDTLFYEGISEIARHYRQFDVCLLHLGGTRIGGILLTMDAQQGVAALRQVEPSHAIPIHFDDYTLFKSPLSDFQEEVAAADLKTQVHYLARGETFCIPPSTSPGPGGDVGGIEGSEPERGSLEARTRNSQ